MSQFNVTITLYADLRVEAEHTHEAIAFANDTCKEILPAHAGTITIKGEELTIVDWEVDPGHVEEA